MEIKEQAWEKIKYLCQQISDVEWSGIIFVKTEGDIDDIDNFKVTVEDVFLMAIDSKAYTEFEYEASYTTYMMDNPELLEMETQKAHSHNSFGVFFSGTDMEDLEDCTDVVDYYISLIVNNKGEVCAKVAWRASIESKTAYVIRNGQLKEVSAATQEYALIHTDLEITKPELSFPDIDKRIEEIEAENKKKAAAKKSTKGSNGYLSKFENEFPAMQGSFFSNDFGKDGYPKRSEEQIEDFLAYWISGTSCSVEEALELADELVDDYDKAAKTLMDQYHNSFVAFFSTMDNEDEIDVLQEIKSMLSTRQEPLFEALWAAIYNSKLL